jgi:cellulose synthase/poly-beta-1,6-N-acetylglucosamine synthase-like glycosyltransferase
VAAGEYLAIFDADFVPPPGFLRDTLPFFLADDGIGLVQTRWGHLNAPDSLLTRAQAIGIDGHFMIEQSARTFNGLLMNFNGTAGIWRRRAILDAGGWSADTLTEDLDLSYRAQLAGWRTHFLADLEVPGELPASVAAFKSQQFRWAKGSIQTAGKLLPRIWRSHFSVWVKLQATLHLTHYAVHPLMLAVACFTLPAMLLFPGVFSPQLRILLGFSMLVSMIAPNALYLVSQRVLYRNWRRRLRWFPLLMCVGVGLALSNSRAVIEALAGTPSDFVRTPKQGGGTRRRYRVRAPVLPWIELLLGAYCAVGLLLVLGPGKYFLGPFLFIYAAGFFMIGALGLREQREPAARQLG